VKKWTSVAKARTLDGKTLALEEHDGSYTIRVDGIELMCTRQHFSEEKLAELACEHLKGKRNARILVGGLGFGFTLRSCLSAVGTDANVVVAEIFTAVIDWNRNPAYHLAADAMADPRVTIVQQDVASVIRQAGMGSGAEGFDSIILDVDNGPTALSTDGNYRLYDDAGLRIAREALRPDGCIAFWSRNPDRPFQKRMIGAGFDVDVRGCRSRPHSGSWHTIFLGRIK